MEQVKWVHQEHKYGCGIASLAMITGQSYEYVRDWFLSYGIDIEKKKGGSFWDWDAYLVHRGYSVARLFQKLGSITRPDWPPEPFGPVHLCEVRPYGTNAHVVVMLADGTVLDPDNQFHFRLTNYEEVISVAAVYKMEEK